MAVLGVERILRRREADYLIEEKLRHDREIPAVDGEPQEDILKVKSPSGDDPSE
jgi:hypothetical protein